MKTIKRDTKVEMTSFTRPATLKRAVYEDVDIHLLLADFRRVSPFPLPSSLSFSLFLALALMLPLQSLERVAASQGTVQNTTKSPARKLTVPRACSCASAVEIEDGDRKIYAMSRDLN